MLTSTAPSSGVRLVKRFGIRCACASIGCGRLLCFGLRGLGLLESVLVTGAGGVAAVES